MIYQARWTCFQCKETGRVFYNHADKTTAAAGAVMKAVIAGQTHQSNSDACDTNGVFIHGHMCVDEQEAEDD